MRYLASVVTACFSSFGELLALHKRFAELSGGVTRCVALACLPCCLCFVMIMEQQLLSYCDIIKSAYHSFYFALRTEYPAVLEVCFLDVTRGRVMVPNFYAPSSQEEGSWFPIFMHLVQGVRAAGNHQQG